MKPPAFYYKNFYPPLNFVSIIIVLLIMGISLDDGGYIIRVLIISALIYICLNFLIYIGNRKSKTVKKFELNIFQWALEKYGLELTAKQLRALASPWPTVAASHPLLSWEGKISNESINSIIYTKNASYNYLSCGIKLHLSKNNASTSKLDDKEKWVFLTISGEQPRLFVVNRLKRTGVPLENYNNQL